MTALITSQRYNWMGYNGTESNEVDTRLLRIDQRASGSNYDYAHRQIVMADIKERLFLVKRDLDLIPEEERQAEEERRRQRRDARKQRESDAALLQEEEERRKAEESERRRAASAERADERRRKAEEERLRAEAEAARRGGRNSDEDSEDEEERCRVLENMQRSQAEIDAAVKGMTAGTRILLARRGQEYISYLDGSSHSSLAALERYNASHAAAAAKSAQAGATVPAAEEFDTRELHATLDARNAARARLDAHRASNDPTYSARIRKSERSSASAHVDGGADAATLLRQVEEAKTAHEAKRETYNRRAAASGNAIAKAAASHAA